MIIFFLLQSSRWLNGTLLKMKVLYLNFTNLKRGSNSFTKLIHYKNFTP